jgi:hypothetical protein
MPSTLIYTPQFLGTEYSGSNVIQDCYDNVGVNNRNMIAGSEGHYGYPDFPPLSNVGGAFILNGATHEKGVTAKGNWWRGGPLEQHYDGCFSAQFVVGSEGPLGTYSGDSWGATAYSKLKPTQPVFQGLNAIYELREVPDMLRQRFLTGGNPLKSIGNYWLALQFGWKPLLNDIRKTILFQRAAQRKLNWLLENNGKPVRQRVTLQDLSTEPTGWVGQSYGAFAPILSTQYYSTVPTYTFKRWETDKVWASGRFRFWLPDGPRDITYKRRMMAYLYGINPTPKVIYNMIPWSWLIDWFTNASDCLSSLDAGVADRLAADYWYIMRKKTVEINYDCTGSIMTRDNGPIDISASAHNSAFSLYRTKGDPFGFGTNPSGLSPMQLSILGSLGLSRL